MESISIGYIGEILFSGIKFERHIADFEIAVGTCFAVKCSCGINYKCEAVIDSSKVIDKYLEMHENVGYKTCIVKSYYEYYMTKMDVVSVCEYIVEKIIYSGSRVKELIEAVRKVDQK